ncbi:MAG: SBBP repeat-containing protein [Caldisericia bacterium]|nr:SBBP repeat-containing protein [Caldisericia bacterium]
MYQRFVALLLCFVFVVSAGKPALFFSEPAQALSYQPFHCIIENQGQWDSSIYFFGTTSFGGIVFTNNALWYILPNQPPIQRSLPFHMGVPTGVQPSSTSYTYITSSSMVHAPTWSSIQYRDGANGVDYRFHINQQELLCSISISPYTSLQNVSIPVLHKDSLTESLHDLSTTLRTTLSIDSHIISIDDESVQETLQDIHTNPLGISWVGGTTLSPHAQLDEFFSMQENYDAYIKKYHPDGSVAECIVFGGSGWEEVMAIDVSNDGQVYCCGTTDSGDFPYTKNITSIEDSQHTNAFVFSYNPHNRTSKSFLVAGSENEVALDIKINAHQDVLITGYTTSSDFPSTNVFGSQKQNSSQSNVFVVSMDMDNNSMHYSTLIGGSYWDVGFSLCLDSLQNIYVTGYTYSYDFPVTPLAHDTSHNGEEDVFVVRLSSCGDRILFSTFIGGDSFDVGKAIACDWEGNVFIAGYTNSSSFPITSHHIQGSLHGNQDGFIAKLSGSGSILLSSSFIGGSSWDEVTDLITDHWGNVFIVGNTLSDDFPISLQSTFPSYKDQQDVFFMHINTHMDSIIYSSYFGNNGLDVAGGIGADFYNNLYIAGVHSDTKEIFLHISKSSRTSSCSLKNPLLSIHKHFGAYIVGDPLKHNAFRTIPNSFSFLDAVNKSTTPIQIETSGEYIVYLQMILNANPLTQLHRNPNEAGFEGNETSYFGYYTQRALQTFQKLHDIPSTGIMDRETATSLDQYFVDLQKKPIKLVPTNWVVKPILQNQTLQIVTPNFKQWYMRIQDPTDGTIGWINVNSVFFSTQDQATLASKITPLSPSIDGQRGGSTETIIAGFLRSEIKHYLPDDFPVELSFALIVHESYPDAYHFDNSLVTFDAGRGIQQITTNAYVGSGLGVALFTASGMRYLPYWHCYEPGLPVDYPAKHTANSEKFGGYYWTEAQCLPGESFVYWGGIFQKDQCIGTCIYNCELDTGSRMYTNTPLGIYSNIADGFVVLKDKLAATSKTEECFPIVFSSPFFEQPLTLSEEDVRYISSIQRYHGYFRHPQDDPNSYLYAISLQLKKIGLGIQTSDAETYWFSLQCTDNQALSFIEWAEKVKYVYQNNIETF